MRVIARWVCLVCALNAAAWAAEGAWSFAPADDPFGPCPLDLRGLNEPVAGADGWIKVKGAQFVSPKTGQPVRFWGVNGPPPSVVDRDSLRQCARLLAKRGVNLLRVQLRCFDEQGNLAADAPQRLADIVAAMKAEGIYTHLSVYYPLWLKPATDCPWLTGYDGASVPFTALFFNPDFQARYRELLKALLTTPTEGGRRLLDEPALFGLELVAEDSFFFLTFNNNSLPEAQLQRLEGLFGAWLKQQFGGFAAVAKRWDNQNHVRDNFAEGRAGFRSLTTMVAERSQRDADTVKFLALTQRAFYERTLRWLREGGFRGLVTCSNSTTASPEVFGPIEKWTYAAGDFIDRHSYFGCGLTGPNAEGSLRAGQIWFDRSALRFDHETPGGARLYANPVMDPHYDDKPSMLSEVNWSRPNRYRGEAPLWLACYGALQDSNAIVHFGLDSTAWTTKPGFFMQPWTLMAPTGAAQFPAAALIYRTGLIDVGESMARLNLKVGDLLDLKGTPLPQDFPFDETSVAALPRTVVVKPGNLIDPLTHLVGPTDVTFSETGAFPQMRDNKKFITRATGQVASTTGQLKLDYLKGLLTLGAPRAQGAVGNLAAGGTIDTGDLTLTSTLAPGSVVVVSLDGQPLSRARRALVQVMSEEQPTGFTAEQGALAAVAGVPAAGPVLPLAARTLLKRITALGGDPWAVRNFDGTLRFKRADAANLSAQPLDPNGYPAGAATTGAVLTLRPDVLYYLLTVPGS